uniref:Uncharacterized protein n=1 Tax=Romanomermis culicivorax TaxID=13658 RepID=A0A915LA19_ROMCU
MINAKNSMLKSKSSLDLFSATGPWAPIGKWDNRSQKTPKFQGPPLYPPQNFRDAHVWLETRQLCKQVYSFFCPIGTFSNKLVKNYARGREKDLLSNEGPNYYFLITSSVNKHYNALLSTDVLNKGSLWIR